MGNYWAGPPILFWPAVYTYLGQEQPFLQGVPPVMRRQTRWPWQRRAFQALTFCSVPVLFMLAPLRHHWKLPLLSDGETVILFIKMQFCRNVAPSLPKRGSRESHALPINCLAGAISSHHESDITTISAGTSPRSLPNKIQQRLPHT